MKLKALIIIGVVLLACAAYFFWPRHSGGGPVDTAAEQATTKVRGIIGAMMTYSLAHDGKLPAPDQLAKALVSAGSVKEDAFVVPGAKTTEPPFFGVKAKAAKPFVDGVSEPL